MNYVVYFLIFVYKCSKRLKKTNNKINNIQIKKKTENVLVF